MNTSFNTKHYTYHIGTSLELNSCCIIYWFDSKTIQTLCPDLPSASLNLVTLQDTFSSIKETLAENKMFSVRTNPSEDFVISESGRVVNFDYIIYVSEDGLGVLGFTYFVETQTNKSNGVRIRNMYLNFKFSIVNADIDIKISYTLDPIWSKKDPILPEFFITSKQEILGMESDPKMDFIRYSDDLLQLSSDDNFCDALDSGTIVKNDYWKLWIPPEISMKRIDDFTEYSISLYRGNLLLYRWNNEGNYTIDYITKSNYYGVMKNVKTGRIFTDTDETIETMSGGVAILSKPGYPRCGYSSLFSDHRYVDTSKRILTDPWDNSDNVTIIGNSQTAEDLSLRHLLCPPNKYYYLLEKRGPWYKFLNEQSGIACWASVYGSVYLQEYSGRSAFPISNRVVLEIDQKGNYLNFYLMNYFGSEGLGTREYLLSSDPNIKTPLEYTTKNRVLIDSIRHRPLNSKKLLDGGSMFCGYRGYLFYLKDEQKTLTYL